MDTTPCPVCASLACLLQSPEFCRTVNRRRPGTAAVEQPPAASTAVKVKAGTSANRSKP